MTKEALYYDTEAEGLVHCQLCPHQCRIAEGQWGLCGVRRNLDGRLISTNYGRVAAMALDPVEKKPLYHFLPGSLTLSFAGAGCNMSCQHCQNHSLSQSRFEKDPSGAALNPQEIVDRAVARGLPSISFTYSEPTVFYEMMLDCARLARKEGIKTIMVSNGFINPKPLAELIPVLDAANIDLKGYSEDFYKRICGGRMQPVLETLEQLRSAGVWLEVTTLLIPGHNDDPVQLQNLIRFLVELDPQIPWHLSRFFPQYRLMNIDPTPAAQIDAVLKSAQAAGLKHLYSGNLPGDGWQSTVCAQCQTPLIHRRGYRIERENLGSDFRCTVCNTPLAGVFRTGDI